MTYNSILSHLLGCNQNTSYRLDLSRVLGQPLNQIYNPQIKPTTDDEIIFPSQLEQQLYGAYIRPKK